MADCPTPNKKRYPNEEKARDALHFSDHWESLYTPTGVYRCKCGLWHLTSHASPNRKNRRNRRR